MNTSRFASAAATAAALACALAPAASATDRITLTPGFDGKVRSISAPDAHGVRYVGGEFTAWGLYNTGGSAVFSASTAAVDKRFPNVNGTVNAAVADGDGGVYIGGWFDTVDGQAHSNLAHLMADGSVDPNWNPSTDGGVLAMATGNGQIYLGGQFKHVNGTSRYNAAAVDPSTGQITAWWPMPDDTVLSMAVRGTTVYLGGSFDRAGYSWNCCSPVHNGAAAVDGTTGTALSWDPQIGNGGAPPVVRAMAVTSAGVYMGGDFWTAGGESRSHAAAVTHSGILMPWNPQPNNEVDAIAATTSAVYMAGQFSKLGTTSRNYLAAVSPTGAGSVLPWNPAIGAMPNTLTVSGSTVFVGGSFTTAGGMAKHGVATISTAGVVSPWNPLMKGVYYQPRVKTVVPLGSSVYVGGEFANAVQAERNHVAALDANGALQPWNPNVSGDTEARVNSVALSGSTVYIGGRFSKVGATARNNAAAVSTSGAGVLQPWNPNVTGGFVNAIGVSGSDVYIGGQFAKVAGAPRANLASVSTQGALQPWNPAPNGAVYALMHGGTVLYAGGVFGRVAGTARKGLAAFSASGRSLGTLQPWNPGVSQSSLSPWSNVYALAISGSTVYVGGQFGKAGGADRHALAAISTAGTVLPWNPGLEYSDSMDGNYIDMMVAQGSKVYVAGTFWHQGPKKWAGFDASGNMTSWSPATGTDWLSICFRAVNDNY